MQVLCLMRRALPVIVLGLLVTPAWAQAPVLYGPSLNVDTAKKVAASAVAEARKNNWMMAVAVVDTAGELIYFEKMDGTQGASIDIAIDKGRSSARFKRPTKAFQDAVGTGGEGLRFLGLRGAVPAEGGFPLMMDGRIVGAIGVSGGTGQQDAQSASAGVAAIK
jgi:glc operon protein GlcG